MLGRRQLVVRNAEDLGPVIKQLSLKMHFYGVKVNFEGSELFAISKDRKQISVSSLVVQVEATLMSGLAAEFFFK